MVLDPDRFSVGKMILELETYLEPSLLQDSAEMALDMSLAQKRSSLHSNDQDQAPFLGYFDVFLSCKPKQDKSIVPSLNALYHAFLCVFIGHS